MKATYSATDFNLDFYTEVQDLSHLVRRMGDSHFSKKFHKLSSALCEVVEDYGLVSFVPLAIEVGCAIASCLENPSVVAFGCLRSMCLHAAVLVALMHAASFLALLLGVAA